MSAIMQTSMGRSSVNMVLQPDDTYIIVDDEELDGKTLMDEHPNPITMSHMYGKKWTIHKADNDDVAIPANLYKSKTLKK